MYPDKKWNRDEYYRLTWINPLLRNHLTDEIFSAIIYSTVQQPDQILPAQLMNSDTMNMFQSRQKYEYSWNNGICTT